MAYFPFFVDIEGQDCLIVGGGIVALRKVEVLLGYGPNITVIAPEFAPELLELEKDRGSSKERGPGRLSLERRRFRMEDLSGRDFVVAATEDEELNEQISLACRRERIPVNVVDVKDKCSFIFPSIVREGDLVVGISSGGKSPTVTQELKRGIQALIPEGYGRLVEELGGYRDFVKERVPCLEDRTEIFRRMVDVGRENGCRLNDGLVQSLIKQVLEERRLDREENGKEADRKETRE